jgi:hypothetical protein
MFCVMMDDSICFVASENFNFSKLSEKENQRLRACFENIIIFEKHAFFHLKKWNFHIQPG